MCVIASLIPFLLHCFSDERLDFIVSKYKERKYINFSQFYGQASDLGNVCITVIVYFSFASTTVVKRNKRILMFCYFKPV